MSKVSCISEKILKRASDYKEKQKYIDFEKDKYNRAWDELLMSSKAETLLLEIKSLQQAVNIQDKLNLAEIVIKNAKELAEAIYRSKH